MDDMNAFERLVADEVQAEAGPSRPTDVAAVIRSAVAKSPKWRFRSMFSATKMLAATAVVALFGGLLVVGQLTQSVPNQAPAADAGAVMRGEPVEFQGRWSYGGELQGGAINVLDDGWWEHSDRGWGLHITEPGDPRLDGELTLRASAIQKAGTEIWNGAFRIENEAGTWQQRPMIQSVKLSGEPEPMTWTAVFDGEDGYEGLTAVIGITRRAGGWDVEGVVIDGALPPTPTVLTREWPEEQ
jgi:hypothetical protein